MALPTILSFVSAFFLVVHLATLAVAAVRCRPQARRVQPGRSDADTPPVTVVRPLHGVESFSTQNIAAAFALDYPAFELLFCVAQDTDPVIPIVRAAIAAHPKVDARLLIGDDRISINPKLNNMVKGWRHAAYEWIVFIDSNVLVQPNTLARLVATFRPDTGVVSAPPCGILPSGFGAHVECAFLNTYEARWQYVVDTFGQGFAQGKTLFYRKADLDRSAMTELAAEPAEDAATTKMVRATGKRVRLAPPSPQPLGVRPLRNVWDRQLRWARLRRATFLLEFLPEILSGAAVPACVTIAAAAGLGLPVLPSVAAYLLVWYVAELAMAAVCRWPVAWQTPLACLIRDLLLPALWVGAFTGRSFTWNGQVVRMEGRASRSKPAIETAELSPE
jgi:ceramide glucosyltransferase